MVWSQNRRKFTSIEDDPMLYLSNNLTKLFDNNALMPFICTIHYDMRFTLFVPQWGYFKNHSSGAHQSINENKYKTKKHNTKKLNTKYKGEK